MPEIRTHKGLNIRLQEWFNSLNNNDEKTLIVAIARKSPRLYEYCQMMWGDKFSSHCLFIVSEHALPFLFQHDFAEKYHKVILVDEAIYNGTTFERIHSLLLTGFHLVGDKSEADLECLPAVVSSSFRNPKFKKGAYEIKEDEIPFYIDNIIMKFQTLGKPYDIEFPLVYIDTNFSLEQNLDLALKIAQGLVEEYGSDKSYSYKVSHRNINESDDGISGWSSTSANYSVVLDPLINKSSDIMHPEFWKIRIYAKESRLCIVCFAPYVIPLDYLERLERQPDLFFQGAAGMGRIWTDLYTSVVFGRDATLEPDDRREEYIYHCRRTLVITANYLFSFLHLTKTIPNITDILKENGVNMSESRWRMEEQDLAYLFGPDLAARICPELMELIHSKEEPANLIQPKISHYSLMPDLFTEDFNRQNSLDFVKCRTISELMSCNFSNQRRLIERPSRNVYMSLDRLRYGESFTALHNKFMPFYVQDADRRKALHQALDKRIDEGSIVPNYVLDRSQQSNPFVRMFRSGENEDRLRDQLAGLICYIVRKIGNIKKISKIDECTLQYIFHLLLINPLRIAPFTNICGIRFISGPFDEKKGFRTLFIYDEEKEPEKSEDLLEFALRFELLKKEEVDNNQNDNETSVVYSLCINNYTQSVGQTTQLDWNAQSLLDAYCRAASFVSRWAMPSSLIIWQQWYHLSGQYDAYNDRIRKWANEQLPLFFKEGGCDSGGMYDSFYKNFSDCPFYDLAKERAKLIDDYISWNAENKDTQEGSPLSCIRKILPDIQNDESATALMNKVYTFYLMVNLLQYRDQNLQMWDEGVIRYGMQEVQRVSSYEGIESWGRKESDVINLLANDNFIGLTEQLLTTVLYA